MGTFDRFLQIYWRDGFHCVSRMHGLAISGLKPEVCGGNDRAIWLAYVATIETSEAIYPCFVEEIGAAHGKVDILV